MSDHRGDSYYSAFEAKIWSLQQEVLFRWHTLVFYKYEMWNVPQRKNGRIMFFVPADATHRFEIVKFLEHELEKERREGRWIPEWEEYWPGMDVDIHTSVEAFRGLDPYLERDQAEKMAKEWIETFRKRLKREDEKKG